MAKKNLFNARFYVRTHPISKRALKSIYGQVASKDVTFQGVELTQEAFTNATWELLDELGGEWVSERLRPILARMEAYEPKQTKRHYAEKMTGGMRIGGEAQAEIIHADGTKESISPGEIDVPASSVGPDDGEAGGHDRKAVRAKKRIP